MVEMNVAQENVANIVNIESRVPKLADNVLERRLRPGIEQRDSIVRFKRRRGDDFGVSELPRIQDVNLHFLLAATM